MVLYNYPPLHISMIFFLFIPVHWEGRNRKVCVHSQYQNKVLGNQCCYLSTPLTCPILPHLPPPLSHLLPSEAKAGSCPGCWTLRSTYICTFLKLKTSRLMVFECNRTMSDLQDVCANVAQMYNNILFYIVYLKEIKLMSQCRTLESFKTEDVCS